jgi:hypothetical protein
MRFNHPKRFHISGVHWPGVARQQVTFSCLAKRKFTKEKATPFAGLRLPAADRLKPGNAETRFAIKLLRKRSSNIRIAVNRLEPAVCGSSEGTKTISTLAHLIRAAPIRGALRTGLVQQTVQIVARCARTI